MTDNYKKVKSQIWWKKVKGWFGSVSYYILTPAGWILTTLGVILIALGSASHKEAEKANTYSENKFAEAQELRKEAEAQKSQDNQIFFKRVEKAKRKKSSWEWCRKWFRGWNFCRINYGLKEGEL